MNEAVEILFGYAQRAADAPRPLGLPEPADCQRAACQILIWLRSRCELRRPWQLRLDHPPRAYDDLRQMIAVIPELARTFAVNDNRLDFSPSMPGSERSAIEAYVAQHHLRGEMET